MELIHCTPLDWMPLANLLDREDTGRFVAKWFPGFQVNGMEHAKKLLSYHTVFMSPDGRVAVIFEVQAMGQVMHVLAHPDARHGQAQEVVEEAMRIAFMELGFHRLLGLAPVDHEAIIRLGLKVGMKHMGQWGSWVIHHLDWLTWMTTAPNLIRLGQKLQPGREVCDAEFALVAIDHLTQNNPSHPMREAAGIFRDAFGASEFSREEV